jgi:hypothetical protein
MGINISHKSQQLPLINQRGRRICLTEICVPSVYLCALYLSLSVVLFVAVDPRYLGVDLHAHTLSLSVSVSPLPGLSFFPLKRRCAAVVVIIEIQDSFVFGCSHFISVALTRKKVYDISNFFYRFTEFNEVLPH